MEVSSTSEMGFQQENNTVSYLTSTLEPDELADQSCILPRDRQAHDPVPENLVENLKHSFGSDPSSIFDNLLSLNWLRESKV